MAPLSLKLTHDDPTLRTLFYQLKSPEDIANLLDVPYKTLRFYIYKKKNYREFEIKKASGGIRVISTPDTPLKIIQRKLAHILLVVYGGRSCVHGFVKDKSIRSNASRHLDAEWILNFDLKDFFPSIHFGRVSGLFLGKPFKFSKNVALTLARICCHSAHLPIGAPTSPIVANLICAKMDSELKLRAWTSDCKYTRYADDITFSTRSAGFPPSIVIRDAANKWALSPEVEAVLKNNNFSVNPNKTRVRGKNSCQEITGIKINSGLNVNRKLYRQVRAMLNAWEKFGESNAEVEFWNKYRKKQKKNEKPRFRNVLRGKIEFIGFVKGRDSQAYVNLLQRLQRLSPDIHAKPIVVNKDTNELVIRQSIWLLYDAKEQIQGTAFAVAGGRLFTAAHNLNQPMLASRPGFSKEKYLVTELFRDPDRDLAIFKINCHLPVVLEFRKSQSINLMSSVCVAGFPHYHLNDSVAFRFGKVVQTRDYFKIPHFIVDADIVKGNSGGPVLDQTNKVIGVAVKGLDAPGSLGENDELSSFVPVPPDLF